MYKDGDTWYVLRLRFRNVILSVCRASKVEPHPDCLLAVTSLSWVGCFFASSRQTTAINVEPWDVVNACKTRETGRWCQQWECPGSERWGEISKVNWRENEVRGQIIDQLVWFCPLFSCLMHVFFKKTKKKTKNTDLSILQFSDSACSKLFILSHAALLHPDWLVRISRWQRSQTTAFISYEPRLVAAQLGTRLMTLWSPAWHWITEMYFSNISYKLLLCLRSKTKSLTRKVLLKSHTKDAASICWFPKKEKLFFRRRSCMVNTKVIFQPRLWSCCMGGELFRMNLRRRWVQLWREHLNLRTTISTTLSDLLLLKGYYCKGAERWGALEVVNTKCTYVFWMSRAPLKAQRLRRLQGEGRSDSCNITVSKHLQKVSSLRNTSSPRPHPSPANIGASCTYVQMRLCASRACVTSVEVDHTASLGRSIPPNRIGAHATILKANPSQSDMQRDAEGGSSVTSWRRARMLLFMTEGEEKNRPHPPTVCQSHREIWEGGTGGGQRS